MGVWILYTEFGRGWDSCRRGGLCADLRRGLMQVGRKGGREEGEEGV